MYFTEKNCFNEKNTDIFCLLNVFPLMPKLALLSYQFKVFISFYFIIFLQCNIAKITMITTYSKMIPLFQKLIEQISFTHICQNLECNDHTQNLKILSCIRVHLEKVARYAAVHCKNESCYWHDSNKLNKDQKVQNHLF